MDKGQRLISFKTPNRQIYICAVNAKPLIPFPYKYNALLRNT